MVITVLAENTSASQELGCEHGLSLHIETRRHRLLFDTGASGLFAENARKLGIDLAEVDTAVISHGHSDHGGGLSAFLRGNGRAKVYLNKHAFGRQYGSKAGEYVYAGLDQTLLPNGRFVFCGEHCAIDEELILFSGVRGQRLAPSGNADMFIWEGGAYRQDDFSHEQNLAIVEDGIAALVCGCAHRGILNILERFEELQGCAPDFVIGGFHLCNPARQQSEEPEKVDHIASVLLDTAARYYTCHCTGLESYQRLKARMGERVAYLSTGDHLSITAQGGGALTQCAARQERA